MVLVMRCDEGPAHVPSDVVTCFSCGADCWLSKFSGASTIAASQQTAGESLLVCQPCLDAALRLAATLGGSS